MCKLFAITSKEPVNITNYLREFYKDSLFHKDGYGLYFRDNSITNYDNIINNNNFLLLKGKERAIKAKKLNNLLNRKGVVTNLCLSHIRLASRGEVCLNNSHPFLFNIRGDNWSFIHNGTLSIKSGSKIYEVKGTTDSEKFFSKLASTISNLKGYRVNNLDSLFLLKMKNFLAKYSLKGKLNIIFTDSNKRLYVFSNRDNQIHYLEDKEKKSIIFSTSPIRGNFINSNNWISYPKNFLSIYEEGQLIKSIDISSEIRLNTFKRNSKQKFCGNHYNNSFYEINDYDDELFNSIYNSLSVEDIEEYYNSINEEFNRKIVNNSYTDTLGYTHEVECSKSSSSNIEEYDEDYYLDNNSNNFIQESFFKRVGL